jgi:hypothetical protein
LSNFSTLTDDAPGMLHDVAPDAEVLVLTMGGESALATHPEYAERVADLDLYRLGDVDLSGVRGLLVGPHADQVYLRRHRSLLDGFVWRGGRLVVCAQVVQPFATGLTPFVPLRYRGVADLTVRRLAEHPVWHGVDPQDLTFRRGVAGFYGRGHHHGLPADALVVHGLGPEAHPLDAVYPHGAGQVLLHGGNDLWDYARDTTTAARMAPQLLDWIHTGTGAGR